MHNTLTHADLWLIAVAIAGTIGSVVWVSAVHTQAARIIVDVDGRPVYTAPLSTPCTKEIAGTRGMVRVEIEGGRVRIAEADCPNHVCVRSGWHNSAGDVIVCVPNKTIVRIMGGDDTDVRAITG